MMQAIEALIHQAYSAFNNRDIDGVLLLMTPDVHWPNGWEGGYVEGHDEVRAYWTRQWKELDPHVQPISIHQREDGKTVVDVHQQVKEIQGKLLFDGMIKHIYTIESGLIKSMEIAH